MKVVSIGKCFEVVFVNTYILLLPPSAICLTCITTEPLCQRSPCTDFPSTFEHRLFDASRRLELVGCHEETNADTGHSWLLEGN